MTQQQIHDSLDAMLANPKSRNFLNHLVRAYFPMTNVDKVWDKPEGSFKCVITKEELISVQEIMNGMQTEEFKQDFMAQMRTMLDENASSVNPIKNLVGEKILGFRGTNTTTYMCLEAVQEFYNWVITKSLKGDKHINWLIGSIKRATFLERAEQIQDADVQKKIKNIKKEQNKASTYNLGDVDSFKKLREKFKG